MTREYKFKPEHVRKLRALRAELESWNKAFINAWNNQEYEAAKEAKRQANLAYGRLLAYENKLVGWQEQGIPCDGYAR